MFKKFLTSLFLSSLVFQPLTTSAYAEEVSLGNSSNGAGSENNVVIEISRETTIESSNEANIENNVAVDANTGENMVTANVGDVSVETGDITVDVGIVNDVNKASTEVDVCCCGGEYDVSNSKNGADSQNNISVSIGQSVTINDYKNANIGNSVDVDANTGGNNIGGNVGGVNLKTGDIGVLVTIGNEANENEAGVHCGGPEEPGEPEEPGDGGNGGPEEPGEPESGSEEPSEDGGEESSEDGESAKPYEDPRPGPTFDSGAVLAAAIGGDTLPITGPCEWTYLLTLLLFLLAHSSRRLSYRYIYS